MLKALELLGFKSFADKTRFEFPSGITVVVGPNGSGKSNVVDAIKWVLGEQSVKSLRGQEMADVIFNGSGTRRGMNSAEITLTFDNSNHLLPVDTPEVHITRRVYRSGEGEYLINRSPSRLRDIRDLLSGTGMGTQAYSVIEQGKVDVLLQASPRDRRLIFEEAAGISRFKAKKIEALRRLERVDQNLLRLSDIVDEVESRLRSVRLQAGKARRYKEHTDRLQELRTQVGLVDWRRLSERLAEFEGELQAMADQRDASIAASEAAEARTLELDGKITEGSEAIRQSEARIAANRERIAAQESTIDHERAHQRDLQQEIGHHQHNLVNMSARAGDLRQQLRDTGEAVGAVEQDHRQIAMRLAEGQRDLTGVISQLDQIRGEHEQRRADYMDRMRRAAELGNETSALDSQVAAAVASRDRCQRQTADLDHQLDTLTGELADLRARQTDLSQQVDRCGKSHQAAAEELTQLESLYAQRCDELAEMRQRRSAASERTDVLEELARRQEGLSGGVKEVLARARQGAGPFTCVQGLVADVFHVTVEIAPLIEVALGPMSQHVVVEAEPQLLGYLEEEAQRLPGRVGFVPRDTEQAEPVPSVDLEGRHGVLGRADRFVDTEPAFASLAQRLLGRTWIVEKLNHAAELADTVRPRLNYVTLAGELLTADGTLVVGPHHASTGLISRRSQLRALQEQLEELHAQIEQAEQATGAMKQQIGQQKRQVDTLADEHQQAVGRLAEHGFKITSVEDRRGQLDQQRGVLQAEHQAAVAQHETASQRLEEARRKHQQLETSLADMEAGLTELDREVARMEQQRQHHNRETTQTQVELAKSEERLRNLHARMRQFEESKQERHRAISDAREQLARCAQRVDQSGWNILRAESEVAELYLEKEAFAAQTVELIEQREAHRQRRDELTAEVQKTRATARKLEEKIHARDLAASEVRHDRNGLADRLREDYGIELAELEHEPSDEEQRERTVVQQEIEELRRKIGNLGHVNIEALEELESLESRHRTLAGQYGDLSDAKASLEKIIDKINIDSRRLFSETLQTVKGHFQQLFRDLFGGGQGDIILDDTVDILESGIEIVARPPGKEPRSISLLSGGEKTLTCVALLLAIFRSRPSPFCVLDEVDAALDEVNIDRFTQVLQDFLAWTQFIIVTHSKKTMTCADTIYGVTMQESGVSKQVSVRFEDVSEDGHIRAERLETEPDTPSDDETQAA